MIELNTVIQGDCIQVMKDIDDESIDMVLCDLPYQVTNLPWDTIIPFEPLWAAYKRIIKKNGAIVLTASQPFTSKLVMSNLEMFKYEWIWEKSKSTGFLDCSYRPMRSHENILVFYTEKPTYNAQKEEGEPWNRGRVKRPKSCWGEQAEHYAENTTGERHPKSVIKIPNGNNNSIHPTQKPTELFSYLIRTYTNAGDLVLDNTSGSCTTAISCINTGRNYICIEQDETYCQLGRQRIAKHLQGQSGNLFHPDLLEP